jgi:Ca2+-binding RTX toxin-like protein
MHDPLCDIFEIVFLGEVLAFSSFVSVKDGNDFMRFVAPSTRIYAIGGAADDDIDIFDSPYTIIIGDYASVVVGSTTVGIYNSLQNLTSITNTIGGNDLIASLAMEMIVVGGDGNDTITAIGQHAIICGDSCDASLTSSGMDKVLSVGSTPLSSQLGGDDQLVFTGVDTTNVYAPSFRCFAQLNEMSLLPNQ